jgi:hypothetical protein
VDRQGALHNDEMSASGDCLILGGIDLKPYDPILGLWHLSRFGSRRSAPEASEDQPLPVAELSRAVVAIIIFCKLH